MIREMPPLRCHFTVSRLSKIKKNSNTLSFKALGKEGLPYIASRNANWHKHMEGNLAITIVTTYAFTVDTAI